MILGICFRQVTDDAFYTHFTKSIKWAPPLPPILSCDSRLHGIYVLSKISFGVTVTGHD